MTYTAWLSPEAVAANRRAWTAALRSGSYRQAHRALRGGDGFCCLGVAEDVVDCTWRKVAGARGPATHVAAHGDDGSLTSLTQRGARLLGLAQRSPSVVVWNVGLHRWLDTTLVLLNDVHRFTLAEIADVVDDQGENWDGSTVQAHDAAIDRNVRRVEPRPDLPRVR